MRECEWVYVCIECTSPRNYDASCAVIRDDNRWHNPLHDFVLTRQACERNASSDASAFLHFSFFFFLSSAFLHFSFFFPFLSEHTTIQYERICCFFFISEDVLHESCETIKVRKQCSRNAHSTFSHQVSHVILCLVYAWKFGCIQSNISLLQIVSILCNLHTEWTLSPIKAYISVYVDCELTIRLQQLSETNTRLRTIFSFCYQCEILSNDLVSRNTSLTVYIFICLTRLLKCY